MASAEIGQLLALIGLSDKPVLLVLDEQASGLPTPRHPTSKVLSNRLDVCDQARQQGWQSEFSDFCFTADLMQHCHTVLYRLSKEKRIVEHVLQSAWHQLPIGGELIIAGYKNEGCKTFAKRASESWQCKPSLTRGDGNLHLYRFSKKSEVTGRLNAADYHALHTITEWQGQPVLSKPGVFAWDRIDEGSRLLLDYLPTLLQNQTPEKLRALDLGCGYGLLAMALLQAGCAEVVATDNNAAALLATEHNLQAHLQQSVTQQTVQVVAADCGKGLIGKFDVIVCNPPFHQGFAVEQQLTERFLKTTQALLKKQGRALFVVNSFIPLERKAKSFFSQVHKRLHNPSYSVFELSNRSD